MGKRLDFCRLCRHMSGGAASSATSSPQDVHKKVIVHPIVLLSAVDHYNRVAKNTKKRVVGMLLGESSKGVLDVTSSYAVPFEEDERDPSIWFLDHSFHEAMFAMFKKVNARERLVGWYSTGPKIRPGDLQIDQLVRRYTSHPVMVIIDVKPKELGIPTEAYFAVEVCAESGSPRCRREMRERRTLRPHRRGLAPCAE